MIQWSQTGKIKNKNHKHQSLFVGLSKLLNIFISDVLCIKMKMNSNAMAMETVKKVITMWAFK